MIYNINLYLKALSKVIYRNIGVMYILAHIVHIVHIVQIGTYRYTDDGQNYFLCQDFKYIDISGYWCHVHMGTYCTYCTFCTY